MGKRCLGDCNGSKQGDLEAFIYQRSAVSKKRLKNNLPLKTMKQASSPPDDSFQIRCPRLGQQINFSYCRQENMGLPCFKTLDCWYIHFQVVEYLQQELSPAEWRDAFEKKPTPKMVSLAELIEKAQKLVKKSSL
jgi:hypothetical protein